MNCLPSIYLLGHNIISESNGKCPHNKQKILLKYFLLGLFFLEESFKKRQ